MGDGWLVQMDKLSWEPLSFEEAIDFFKDKLALTPKEYKALEEEVKVKAFTISGITSLEILNDILKELKKALTDGITMKEFRDSANELLTSKGYEGLTPFQADNIFRTNIQTAYNVGRYKQQTEPAVIKRRPFWRYDAINDKKTRPTHRAMDNTVRAADDPFWDTWYPPNGFRCRCSVQSLGERDLSRMGLKVQSGPPPPYVKVDTGSGIMPLLPDPGFAYNPGKVVWHPDLSKFPEQLQKAYHNRGSKNSQTNV